MLRSIGNISITISRTTISKTRSLWVEEIYSEKELFFNLLYFVLKNSPIIYKTPRLYYKSPSLFSSTNILLKKENI